MIDSFKGRWFFLSNFAASEITHEGILYPTVEHYYVAMKVNTSQLIDGVLMDKIDVRELISKIETAGKVKRFGRQNIKLRKDWEGVRYEVMLFGIRQKFKHENLKEMLLQTEGEELIEGNWWGDTFWGICNGVGENNLGKIIMRVREEIIERSLF
jgi:ribA/ribD-fused uncharacterized protein